MHQILGRCSLDTFLLQNLEVSEKVVIFASRNKKLARYDTSYEQSLLDAKEGRVNSYESSEEFFKKMGI